MSGRCPVCGEKRTLIEKEDGDFYCEKCQIPLKLVYTTGGCFIVVKK